MSFRRLLAPWFLASITLCAAPALAGNDAQNAGTARELYEQGATALESGDAAKAVARLTSAWALVQTPVIGTTLARAHRQLGHIVEAREAALGVLRLSITPNETARSTQARTDAEKIANELAPRIAHVKLIIRGLSSDATPTVKLDDVVVPNAALSVALQANPGKHVAVVEIDGRRAQGSVDLTEGQSAELVIDAPAASPRSPETTAVNPSGETEATKLTAPVVAEKKSISPVVWIGVATTGVGLAVGAISGAFAMSASSRVTAKCQAISPIDNMRYCPPDAQGDLSEANTTANVSTVGFIAAGVGAVILIVGVAVSGSSKKPEHARITPMIGPINGIAGTF